MLVHGFGSRSTSQANNAANGAHQRSSPSSRLPVLSACCAAGFVDADEYILLRPDIPSLPALLERFEQYGGLAVFSKSFGSSGHLTRPAVGTRLGFTKCQPASKVCHGVVCWARWELACCSAWGGRLLPCWR